MTQEARGVGDLLWPVTRTVSNILVEDGGQVSACPAFAIDEIGDHVDDWSDVPSVVEAVSPREELGGNNLRRQWARLPGFSL